MAQPVWATNPNAQRTARLYQESAELLRPIGITALDGGKVA
jgi:hypothetical protein